REKQPGKNEYRSSRVDIKIEKLNRRPHKTRKKHWRRCVDCQIPPGRCFTHLNADGRCLSQGLVSLPVSACGENDETIGSDADEGRTAFLLDQCGLNVFPVSSKVLRRERMRGHPSAQAAYVESSAAHSSCVTVTFVASVSGTSSIVARDSLSFPPIAN